MRHLIAFGRRIAGMNLSVYAANACFFLVLAAFPTLVLMLGLLRYTSLEAADLQLFVEPYLPEALYGFVWRIISGAYAGTSKMVVSLSALTALWSAGRGVHGLIRGLNAVYGRREDRGWLRVRLISAAYTFLFLLVLLLTLVLHVFGNTILRLLQRRGYWPWGDLAAVRYILLIVLQTALFSGLYMFLPRGGNRFRESLPGALVSSVGWMSASTVFSLYVAHFPGYSALFGSVYAAALGMLWLYVCVSILFYGGILNGILGDSGGNMYFS